MNDFNDDEAKADKKILFTWISKQIVARWAHDLRTETQYLNNSIEQNSVQMKSSSNSALTDREKCLFKRMNEKKMVLQFIVFEIGDFYTQ